MLWLTVKDAVEDQFDEGLFVFYILPCGLELLNDILKYASAAVLRSVNSLKECFGPYDAVNEFLRPLSNRAHWIALLFNSISALVALREALANGDTSGLVAVRASLNQRDAKIEAHRVDKVSSLIVVQSVNHQIKTTEESVPESVLLDTTNVV